MPRVIPTNSPAPKAPPPQPKSSMSRPLSLGVQPSEYIYTKHNLHDCSHCYNMEPHKYIEPQLHAPKLHKFVNAVDKFLSKK